MSRKADGQVSVYDVIRAVTGQAPAPMGELQDSSEKRVKAWRLGYTGGASSRWLPAGSRQSAAVHRLRRNREGTGRLLRRCPL